MSYWYLVGAFILFCIAAPHLSKLPKVAQNVIAVVIFIPILLGFIWAMWFTVTGQADPSILADYIKR